MERRYRERSNFQIQNKNVKTYPVLSPSEQERNPKETEWYEDRVIIKTVFETEQGDIAVINTHFGLNPQEQKI